MPSKEEAAAELLKRRQARTQLHDFIQYINPEYITSKFSVAVCEALEQFYIDVKQGLRPVLILEAPPQHGKSEIVSRSLSPWLFGQDPNLCIGGLSYGKDLASDMNRDIQRIMLNESYGALFPDSALNKKRVVTVEVEAKRNSDTFEIVGHKGRYVSQGVGGPLTGKRLDIGIIDDPIKNSKEALSPTVKEALWNWYITTFLTRLSKNSGQIIMATRWATDDLSGRILETNPRARRLSFPAISEDGEALAPELHPIEKLLETKAAVSEHFWSAMYMQSPVVMGGNVFKNEWWRYYSVLPTLEYRMMFADTAQKTGQQNDYSVFQCWGKSKDGKIYLIDQVRGKWESPQLLSTAKAFWAKHQSPGKDGDVLRKLKIEDKSSGTGLIQQLKQSGIPVEGIPRNTDKLVRALDVSPMIEAGLVYLPEQAPWLSDLVIEAAQFPAGPHDDQLDPLMDAISDMLIKQSSLIFEAL
jgi:predicted phage terminase large subunit-like protein